MACDTHNQIASLHMPKVTTPTKRRSVGILTGPVDSSGKTQTAFVAKTVTHGYDLLFVFPFCFSIESFNPTVVLYNLLQEVR